MDDKNNLENITGLNPEILGKSLLREYNDKVKGLIAGWYEDVVLSGGDIQELLALMSQVREFSQVGDDLRRLELGWQSGFFPRDLALVDTETDMPLSENKAVPSGGTYSQPMATGRQKLPETEVEVGRETRFAEISVQDLGEKISGEYQELVQAALSEFPNADLMHADRAVLDVLVSDELDNSEKIIYQGIEQPSNLESEKATITESEKGSPLHLEGYIPIKGLKDFAQYLEANPPGQKKASSYSDNLITGTSENSEKNDREHKVSFSSKETHSRIIHSNDSEPVFDKAITPEEINLLLGEISELGEEHDTGELTLPGRDFGIKKTQRSKNKDAGTASPVLRSKILEAPGYQTNNKKILTRDTIGEENRYVNLAREQENLPAGNPEIDMDEIYEALAEEIYRDYKRIYGS